MARDSLGIFTTKRFPYAVFKSVKGLSFFDDYSLYTNPEKTTNLRIGPKVIVEWQE